MDASPLTSQETACYQVMHRILANHLQQGMGWSTLLTVVVRLLGQCVLQVIVTRSVRLADLAFMDELTQILEMWFSQAPTQARGLVLSLPEEEAPYGEQAAYTLWAGLGRVLTEYREEHGLTVWSAQRVSMRLLCDAGVDLSLALAHDTDERQRFFQVLQEGWRSHVHSNLRRRRRTA
ncbi:MAG: hypothetical protein AB7N91_12975 [Candidatus Tectimicrobiota bacterium]